MGKERPAALECPQRVRRARRTQAEETGRLTHEPTEAGVRQHAEQRDKGHEAQPRTARTDPVSRP